MGIFLSCFETETSDKTIEQLLREYDIKHGYHADGTLIYSRIDPYSDKETTLWRVINN